MKPTLLAVLLAVLTLGAAPPVAWNAPADKPHEKLARLGRLLSTVIDTADFPQAMPLAEGLKALEAKLPRDRKVALRLDEKAFGTELPRMAATQIRPQPMKTSLETILRRTLAAVPTAGEVDFDLQGNALVVSRPQLLAFSMKHDVRDLVKELPFQLPAWKLTDPAVYEDLDPSDGPGLLVRVLTNTVAFRSWEMVRIENGIRLVVYGSPARQAEVDDLCAALRRLADTRVVMNARLYEVDRAFFTREVAPLLAREGKRPGVASLDGPLFQKITRQKLLLTSENTLLRPGEEVALLSRHSAVRFRAAPLPGE
jgi:hypothetical protein